MNTYVQSPLDQTTSALIRYREGCNPALIELPEKAVFPGLINAQPSTARKSRTTGILLGRPAPRFVKHGRTVRYRLKDVLEWLEAGKDFSNTAEVGLEKGVAE
ncbi:MAG: hypothetical protein IKE45_10510 [Halomonas sp.]|nr:hypothetical protein [Halomonas sp.]MBR2514431.1 hypothetical protein [Halomonas sp.]